MNREAAPYRDYAVWKSWHANTFLRPSRSETATYEAELPAAELAGRAVLEIGFGNGGFLGWARARGAELWGSEIQPELIDRARAEGVQVADVGALLPEHEGRFAIVAAWDVLEHVPVAALPTLLETICALLADDGLFVARFPNGQSPLGRVFQHGDVTHVTVLSPPILRQLTDGLPLRPLKIGNPAALAGLIGRTRWAIHRLAERLLQLVYGIDAPLAPNTIALLRRAPRPDG